MIKIHPNIIIGSPSELTQIINSVHYIINCSIALNNKLIHPNYINLNISQFNYGSLQILNSMFDFINLKIRLNQNIFLLCETGIDNSLIVGMFIMMKLHNSYFKNIYYQILNIYNNIKPYDFYAGLEYYEQYILNAKTNEMDIS